MVQPKIPSWMVEIAPWSNKRTWKSQRNNIGRIAYTEGYNTIWFDRANVTSKQLRELADMIDSMSDPPKGDSDDEM